MKRISGMFLCVLLVFSCAMLLFSCGGADVTTTTGATTTTPSGSTDTPAADSLAALLAQKKYKIIAPQKQNDDIDEAVGIIEQKMNALSGKEVKVSDDFVKKGQEIPNGAFEILVGVTNRNASKDAKDALFQNRPNANRDWVIQMKNNEVVILAGDNEGIVAAANAFAQMLSASASTYSLENYDSGIQIYSWELSKLGSKDVADFCIVIPDGASKEIQTVAATMQKNVYEVSGFSLEIVTDKTAKTDAELVLGATNRAVTACAMEYLNDYRKNNARDGIVYEDNGALAVTAGSEEGLASAVQSFSVNYLKKEKQLTGLRAVFASASVKNLCVGESDLSEYKIVLRDGADFDTRYLAYHMKNFFYEDCGYNIAIVTDQTAKTGKEILLGASERLASTATSLDAYSVKVDANGNLVFDAGHYVGLQQAYADLLAFLTQQSGDDWKIGATYTQSGAVENVALTWEKDTSAEQLLYDSGITDITREEKTYTLVWNDEFDGTKIDYEKWSGRASMNMASTTLRYDEEGSDNVSVSGGKLILKTTLRDQKLRTYYSHYGVTTADTMNFSGGYLEMRAAVPFKAMGEWPSFWSGSAHSVLFKQAYRDAHNGKLYEAGYRVEVDFFEQFSSKDTVVPNLHKWLSGMDTLEGKYTTNPDGTGAMPNRVQLSGIDAGASVSGTRGYKFKAKDGMTAQQNANGYHTYGFLWTDDLMSFSVDGEFYYSYSMRDKDQTRFNPTYYHKDTHEARVFDMGGYQKENMALSIILNDMFFSDGLSSSSFGYDRMIDRKNDDEFFPLVYTIDYMRLYQCDEDFLYTPDVIGQGTMLLDQSRYQYAYNGTK